MENIMFFFYFDQTILLRLAPWKNKMEKKVSQRSEVKSLLLVKIPNTELKI